MVAAATLSFAASAAEPSVPQSDVDALFAKWTSATPGCAVGVASDGRIVLEKAYGMADLEHDVPNAPDTIFEAGSVSKQFTAMAVLLLARDGKLSLDDPIRKHVPELPEYRPSPTIRQMLHHTSGLRDWGSVEEIAGWPRGTRVYTHAHVLDILGRQSALNFTPGSHWSYSNSGYNLAAIIVSRVSGEPFAEFTRKRIFEPLGMTRTSWRDDFTRIVKGRAMAYSEADGRYHTDMPFEDVHGNGGLLTTVGDLLRWSQNFVDPKVGDEALIREMESPGHLQTGLEHGYGFGLYVDHYKGLREFRHSGTTASYRALLARYPDAHLAVAMLCNAGSSMPRQTAREVADLYLPDSSKENPPKAPVTLTAVDLDAHAGLYRNVERGDAFRIARNGNALRLGEEMPLVALSARRFTDDDGTVIEFDGAGRATMDEGIGSPVTIERVPVAQPDEAALAALAGNYVSDDAEATLAVRVRDGALEMTRRPDSVFQLTPLYADAFESDIGTIIFRRDAQGWPAELSVVRERVWDLRFQRQP